MHQNVFAQGVSIGSAQPAHASALLDVGGLPKGVLLPRLSTAQRNALALPATALLIYNSNLNRFEVNIGTPEQPNWHAVYTLDSTNAQAQLWRSNGNAGTKQQSFLGTTDSVALQLKTNNVLRLYIHPDSLKVGLGTNQPRASLHINSTDAIIVPVGTTQQRPPTPVVGMLRFNSTTGKLEGFTTNGWEALH